MFKAKALIRIGFSTKRQTLAVADALRPEAAHPARERAHVSIVTKGRVLIVYLEAKDSTTLRAITNSYLRLLAASLNVLLQLKHSRVSATTSKH